MSSDSPSSDRPFKVIAITSGKGGVGKTSIIVNLAVTYASDGRKVLIIDGDVGLANVDILLDEVPRYTLADVLTGERRVEEILVESPHGVTVMPGASGVTALTRLDVEQRRNLMAATDGLEAAFDTVLIDTAAGIGDNVVFFAGAAAEVHVVVTPEPTSLADAYAVIKTLATRAAVRRVGIIVNEAPATSTARDVFSRLSALVGRFLPVVVEPMGSIPRDSKVHEAIMMQQPLVTSFPNSKAAAAIRRVADAILMGAVASEGSGRLQFFWQQLIASQPIQGHDGGTGDRVGE